MGTNYPGGLDDFTNPQSGDPQNNPSHSAQHRNANDAIEAIEAELGVTPSGAYDTVAARLDDIDVSGYQPLDSDLTSLAGLGTAADKMAYTTGAHTWAETGLTSAARTILDDASVAAIATTLGLGTGDSPQFTGVNIGHASDTTVTRTGAGDIAIGGNAVYRAGGTDVPVGDGGTGASTAAAARSNLGVAWELISEANPNAATVSFTSIPGTYKHLLIVCDARGNAATTRDFVLVRFNGDTGSNYDDQYLLTTGTSVTGAATTAQSSARTIHMPGTSGTANKTGGGQILIPNYAGTTNHKTATALGAEMDQTNTPLILQVGSGWRSTAAITQIDLHFSAIGTGFVNGSKFSLYGLS